MSYETFTKIRRLLPVILLLGFFSCQNQDVEILLKAEFLHYIEEFNHEDTLDLHFDVIPDTRMISNEDSWDFLKENIPFIECPDKEIEEVYYYRWWPLHY